MSEAQSSPEVDPQSQALVTGLLAMFGEEEFNTRFVGSQRELDDDLLVTAGKNGMGDASAMHFDVFSRSESAQLDNDIRAGKVTLAAASMNNIVVCPNGSIVVWPKDGKPKGLKKGTLEHTKVLTTLLDKIDERQARMDAERAEREGGK